MLLLFADSIHEPGTSVVREDTSGASAPEDASDGDEVSDTSEFRTNWLLHMLVVQVKPILVDTGVL